MLRMKAMRYYRLWIYTCNFVLLVSVLLFVVVGSYIFGDVRMSLVTSVRYYHPTFLYAYAATVLQGGVIQVIGCIGALRLNERLLNVYWMVLLFLLCGDVVVGTVWVFRFQRLCSALPLELAGRLADEYGVRPAFTEVWDHVQWTDRCCGLHTPADYNASEWRRRLGQPDVVGELLPASCCDRRPLAPVVPRAQPYTGRTWPDRYRPRYPPATPPPATTTPMPLYNGTCVDGARPDEPYGRGCLAPLLLWYRQSADLLFVLGYCVIAFLKLCFLGLLRCEIREMIQKIKVLQCETAEAERAELAAPVAANHVATKDNNNGGGAPQRRLPPLDDFGNTSDSETNSHCPLLGRPRRPANGNNNKLAPNRNEAHELLELRPRQHTDI